MRDGTNPELAEAAKVILSGAFVPDELANKLVLDRLIDVPGFVLDGFPRTVPQAEALDRFLLASAIPLHGALLLDADESVIDGRIRQRRICGLCGHTYDLTLDPPAILGRCDDCNGALVRRPEENTAEKAALRRNLYRERTGGVIAFYYETGRLRRIDASGLPVEVESAACEAVRGAV